jgi:uncharacterized repeat protein (TIGR02543 family)
MQKIFRMSLLIVATSTMIFTSCKKDKNEEYTVRFEVNGGSAVAAIKVQEGAKIVKPTPDPTKDGFTFVAWYKEAAFTTEWNFDSDVVTVDLMLYAKWNENSENVNLFYSEFEGFVSETSVSFLYVLVTPNSVEENTGDWLTAGRWYQFQLFGSWNETSVEGIYTPDLGTYTLTTSRSNIVPMTFYAGLWIANSSLNETQITISEGTVVVSANRIEGTFKSDGKEYKFTYSGDIGCPYYGDGVPAKVNTAPKAIVKKVL